MERQRTGEPQTRTDTVPNNIDILLASETHFTDRTVLKIPQYSLYHSNHPDGTAHGGAAIIIRTALQHFEAPAYQTDKIQASILRITDRSWPLHIAALYSPTPHRHRIEVVDYDTFLRQLGLRFIAGGDWNAKHTDWGSRLTTPKGRNLLQSITHHNCSHLSAGTPTYWPSHPNKTPDLLHFFVLKNIGLNYTHIEATRDLSSDHTPIILTLSTHTFSKPAIPRLTSPKADWNNFRAHINENTHLIIQLKLPADIDNAVHTFTCLIQEAARRSTPPATPGNGPTNNTSLHIRALVTEKRRARSRWQRSLNPLDKREYNRLTRHLKTSLQDIRNVTFETYISSLSKEDHSIWKATKQFKRPIPHVPPASARRWHLEHN